ncbi:MAG TPA: S9 family peptidase, partial [Acidobacteriota bacterium]|nr:S9 family peptidase [Acidobacteriota bacterium]
MFRGVKTLVTAFGLSLAVVLSTGTALAQKQRPMEFGDMLRLKRVGSPTLSPDGKWLAFSVSAIDRKSQSSNSDIWIMPAAGGPARQLTMFEKADSEPCWSPDSQSIAFVSTRGGSSQIWMLSLQGGEPRKVTDFFTDVSGLIWSPDGKSMAFTAEIYPDCPLNDAECNKKKYEEAEENKVKAKTATQLLYRHWTSWKEGRRSHIFVVSADSGQVKDVTPGDFDSPPFSIGGADYAFSGVFS